MNYKPIRVLHMIASLNIGGSQMMLMNLYRNIDRTKVQFDFIIDHASETYFKKEVEILGGKVYTLPTFNGRNVFEIKKAWNEFFNLHTEYKVFHTHSRSYASIYLPIARKHGLITISHAHSTSNGKGISAVVKDIMQYPIRFQSDYMFACSDEAGCWLYGKNIQSKNNYMMIPNGIRLKDFQYSKDVREKLRKELQIKDELVVGHAGRFHEAKNHMFLLEIFAKLRSRNKNAKLLLLGDGDLRPSIDAEIDRLGMRESVIMTGMISDVSQYYSVMDVFVFPSLWEGLPVSVVEAQAAGLPCLISNTITRQVKISKLVKTLPINMGTDIWVDAIMNVDYTRKNVTESIQAAGFDIETTAKKLELFYRGIVNE